MLECSTVHSDVRPAVTIRRGYALCQVCNELSDEWLDVSDIEGFEAYLSRADDPDTEGLTAIQLRQLVKQERLEPAVLARFTGG